MSKEKLIEELKYNYENWNAGNFYNEDADYNESLADFILQKQEETRKEIIDMLKAMRLNLSMKDTLDMKEYGQRDLLDKLIKKLEKK